MNPPSALHSAMSRDRKPFTYTPGGINLSEIKSQRMAQRLMRNAMNPGVPEKPVHPVLTSATPTISVPLPNYNCLPVQVFPAMPANPKILLRSRSNPDPRDASVYKPLQPPVNNARFENDIVNNKNRHSYTLPTNNDRRVSLNEYNSGSTGYNTTNINYENERNQVPLNTNMYTSPPSYQSPFVYTPVAPPMASYNTGSLITPVAPPAIKIESDSTPILSDNSIEPEFFRIPRLYDTPITEQLYDFKTCEDKNQVSEYKSLETNNNQTADQSDDIIINPFKEVNVNETKEDAPIAPLITKVLEDNADTGNEQREVKVVKKQVTKESKAQDQNGNENGDANDETEMTVKLPSKKSAAKTETKVEVERKILPDGSVEEVKTTTTKTTIDGRTEIKTRTETTIIPKDEESEEEIVEEEEEEESQEVTENVKNGDDNGKQISSEKVDTPKENGNISKTEERSETTIIKKVAVVEEASQPEQSEVIEQEEEEEEVEEVEEEDDVQEAEPVTIVLKMQSEPEPKPETKPVEEEDEEEEEEVKEEVEETEEVEEVVEESEDVEKEIVENEVQEKAKEEEPQKDQLEPEQLKQVEINDDEEEQEEEYEEVEEEIQEEQVEQKTEKAAADDEKKESIEESKEETKDEETVISEEETGAKEAPEEKEHVIPVKVQDSEEPKLNGKEDKQVEKPAEFTIPIREPSIPLDKVEDIEIKPIGITPIITKTHTENTEIIRSTIDPSGGVSKQTEYNKIENIVTVNRTTKILDQNYENLTQQGIPTVKTYFPPPSLERFSSSPMPSRPYQPVYPPEPATERRHSLLLERLSMERQMPSDICQYGNQSYEQTQCQSEPQSEVLTVSNVKPSTITNQQWYQQTRQSSTNTSQNVLYNNVTSPSSTLPQPKSPQPQQQYQPQPQYQQQSQPQYQAQYAPPPTPQFQRGTTPQPQFQRSTSPQPQYQKTATPQPQYQPSYTEPTRDKTPVSNYSTYTPNPSWVSNTFEPPPAPYSYSKQDTTQSYQKSTLNSTLQYSSGYVPPPWEQDSSYTSVNNTSEKYYQEVPQSTAFSPTPSQGWKPTPPSNKFTKPAPIAYAPPAPNQSFVKPVVEVPRHPGRKTYYSEYERRYITVPESTYIPTETKFQPQPDPSPQYYYDNNEPSEPVEPQWRKELREFTEKTSQTQTVETNVQPPWEVDTKYAKSPASNYTSTPTWSQTLRPQSNRERSFESEYVSQEWPKTNTLGRRRPLSTMGVSTEGTITDRVRGVSVDRYNPNNYQPPAEHPPVQSHTLTTPVHGGYHNPNVPAYHARASAEPREQPTPYQQRVYRESRASPLQSRSFKYLQWITGTEN